MLVCDRLQEQIGVQTAVCRKFQVSQQDESAGFLVLDGVIRALQHLAKGRVVLFAAGTGNPFFTTDSAAGLRAIEIGAEIMFKATNVDGVYTADPKKDPGATRFDRLSYDEALRRNLMVMDHTAIILCRDHNMPLMVFDIHQPGNLLRAVRGEAVGSLVVKE